MQWHNTSEEKPGFTIHRAGGFGSGHHYVIQRNRNSPAKTWRLAFRANETEALRIIYIGNTLKECQDYAELHTTRQAVGENAEL
jgi:hypothetical protein